MNGKEEISRKGAKTQRNAKPEHVSVTVSLSRKQSDGM